MKSHELRALRFELIDMTSSAISSAYAALGEELDDYHFAIDCAIGGKARIQLIEMLKPDLMPHSAAAALRYLILTTCSRVSVEPLEIFESVISIVTRDHDRSLYWFLFDICDVSDPLLEQCLKDLDWLVAEGKLNK